MQFHQGMLRLLKAISSITPGAFIQVKVLHNHFAGYVAANGADMNKTGMRLIVANDLN